MNYKWKDIIKKHNAVFTKLNQRKYSDIGNFELTIFELMEFSGTYNIPIESMESFFHKLDETRYLSKSSIYYDFSSMFEQRYVFYKIITCARRFFKEKCKGYWVLVALYEHYINFLSVFIYTVFSYSNNREHNKQEKYFKKLYEYSCEAVFEYLSLLYDERVVYCNSDDTNILSSIQLIENSINDLSLTCSLDYRVFREYDNKFKCCSELLYVHYLLDVKKIHVNNFAFPLYGSIMLAIFTKPIIRFWGFNDEINVLPLRIGFHDLQKLNLKIDNFEIDKKKILPAFILDDIIKNIRNATTLVIDDNLGNGTTLDYCKKFIEHFDGECITRTAETTWSKYISGEKDIYVDFPAIDDYLRYTQQHEYIQLLRCADVYVRDYEYIAQKTSIGKKEIAKLHLSELQKQNLLLEYEFKKKVNDLHGKY